MRVSRCVPLIGQWMLFGTLFFVFAWAVPTGAHFPRVRIAAVPSHASTIHAAAPAVALTLPKQSHVSSSRATVPLAATPITSLPPPFTPTIVADLSDAARIDRLINLDHPLPKNYTPMDLVRAADYGIPTAKDPDSSEMKLRLAADPVSSDASANLPSRLATLLTICHKETGEVAALRSGYRSYATQAALFARRGFAGGNTSPGTSEHQSGLSFDLAVSGEFITAKSKTYGCFAAHAPDYGFILSYPAGNRYLAGHAIVEPWHWRYVGVDVAQAQRSRGMQAQPQEFLATLPGNESGAHTATLVVANK